MVGVGLEGLLESLCRAAIAENRWLRRDELIVEVAGGMGVFDVLRGFRMFVGMVALMMQITVLASGVGLFGPAHVALLTHLALLTLLTHLALLTLVALITLLAHHALITTL